MKYSERGIVFFGIYIDDRLITGNENGMHHIIDGLKSYKFGLKIADDLKEYLSCRILTDYGRKTKYVMENQLINNFKEKFENEVKNLSDYGTPGAP
jgi:hypothetical protein